LVIAEEKYKVIQSIGQNGIVGRVELNNKDVQQGFLTNTRYFSIRNSDNVNLMFLPLYGDQFTIESESRNGEGEEVNVIKYGGTLQQQIPLHTR